jgi:hypothetical protein
MIRHSFNSTDLEPAVRRKEDVPDLFPYPGQQRRLLPLGVSLEAVPVFLSCFSSVFTRLGFAGLSESGVDEGIRTRDKTQIFIDPSLKHILRSDIPENVFKLARCPPVGPHHVGYGWSRATRADEGAAEFAHDTLYHSAVNVRVCELMCNSLELLHLGEGHQPLDWPKVVLIPDARRESDRRYLSSLDHCTLKADAGGDCPSQKKWGTG